MNEQGPYTPTTEQIRTEWVESGSPAPTPRLHAGAAFDRWLAAHDEAVRADQREEDARIAETAFGSRYSEPYRAGIAARIRAQGKEQDRG